MQFVLDVAKVLACFVVPLSILFVSVALYTRAEDRARGKLLARDPKPDELSSVTGLPWLPGDFAWKIKLKHGDSYWPRYLIKIKYGKLTVVRREGRVCWDDDGNYDVEEVKAEDIPEFVRLTTHDVLKQFIEDNEKRAVSMVRQAAMEKVSGLYPPKQLVVPEKMEEN